MATVVIGESRLSRALSYVWWPVLYVGGLYGAYLALGSARPLLWFNVVYLSLIAIIAVLERFSPHEPLWLAEDGETGTNVAHTLFTKGLVQIAAALVSTATMATAIAVQPQTHPAAGLWPGEWPLFAQVALGLVIAELGLYAAHRIAHEWPKFWRFHALHHSVERLWVVNTGRFHIVDTCFKAALGQIPLYFLGAPLPVFLWISAVTAVTGILTHCNVVMRTGPIDWFLSTPRLHRWHHSKLLEEGNRNYGENLVLWDQLFGTYYNPDRPPPADIGIHGRIAKGFLAQLVQPFHRRGVREIMGDDAAH
ncbi:MAG TPA: sterol desaturase family protein [Tahibacter sp.]|uniref:Sterol desaturase family protein n=1 Tax=Tahibacter soli TaxID=2983605 RepID=A0A9X3YJH7_9GAMM|nr:sterol desaturase family protein [Tahibacter soli]MDC8013432.1 sterol desaturase family protein [Tahibacter soli]HVJ62311.1 sterol desaturase family protein [Tahibacter sp.]